MASVAIWKSRTRFALLASATPRTAPSLSAWFPPFRRTPRGPAETDWDAGGDANSVGGLCPAIAAARGAVQMAPIRRVWTGKAARASGCCAASRPMVRGRHAHSPQPPHPRPRAGGHNDKAHPPIHPTAPFTGEGGEKGRLYEFICRHFLAYVLGGVGAAGRMKDSGSGRRRPRDLYRPTPPAPARHRALRSRDACKPHRPRHMPTVQVLRAGCCWSVDYGADGGGGGGFFGLRSGGRRQEFP